MLAVEPPAVAPSAQTEPAPAAPQTPISLDPRMFVRTPRQSDWDRWLPVSAYRYPVLSVTLKCVVGDGGRMDSCVVVSESPVGVGVGQAALKVSSKFQMPALLKGQSTKGGIVTIPLHMQAPM